MGSSYQAAAAAEPPKPVGLAPRLKDFAKGALLGCLSVWSLICFLGASENTFWKYFVILGWPVWLWLVVVVHELGHAAAAWACRWRVVAIATGPIGFHLVNRDWAFIPRSKRSEFEGFVLPVPTDRRVWNLPRKIMISAGGPAANIALAAVLLLWPATAGSFKGAWFDYSLVAAGAGWVSLAVGLSALLDSDGEHILGALRMTKPDWQKYRAFSYLYTLLHHQVRLRDLPWWILQEASDVAAREGSDFRLSYDTILVGMILDSPPVETDQARSMIDRFREENGESAWLNSCDAYLAAVWERDAVKARSVLWRGDTSKEMKPLTLAAEAAVLAREGKADAARTLLAQMRKANREQSIFPDHTFRDIGHQIEAIVPA